MIVTEILDEIGLELRDFSKISFSLSKKKVIFFPCSRVRTLKNRLKSLYRVHVETDGNCEILKIYRKGYEIIFNMPCKEGK